MDANSARSFVAALFARGKPVLLRSLRVRLAAVVFLTTVVALTMASVGRAFVDAAEAKKVLADATILQLDGAHNANATAKQAWKVTPELLVQHAINSAYSRAAGMAPRQIALSTVPPTAPLTLFVWGPKRVLPVKLSEFSITEEAFDPNLNPLRARVSLGLRVLSYNDLPLAHPGYALFLTHQVVKEAMAVVGSVSGVATASLPR